MRKVGRWFNPGRLFALAALILLLTIRIFDPVPVQLVRFKAFDQFQQLKPREFKPFPVVIIDIDEASLKALGQWPWPRTRLAELVQKLTGMGVVAIAFDVIFSEPDRLNPKSIAADNAMLPPDVANALKTLPSNDQLFANAIARSRVVLGQTSVRSLDDERINDDQPPKDMPHAILGPHPSKFVPALPALVQNLPELENAAAGRGVFSLRRDADNVIRSVPLLAIIEDKLRLSLSVELLRVATGSSAFAVKSNAAGVEGVKIGRTLVQTNALAQVWPYFRKSDRSRFVSIKDIVDGTVDPARLRGHLALVGTSAVGLNDIRATAIGESMPGVEIHAQVIENIMGNTMLVRPNFALVVELAAILFLGLCAIIFVPLLGATWATLSALVVLGGYVAACWFAFTSQRMLVDPVYPTISVAVVFVLMSVFNYMREEKRRQEIRSAFGQYVSPDLVNDLADNPQNLSLGGETRDLTILFSDVRGFTTISESYRDNPQGLTRLMNEFLNCLSNAVLRQNGTIDKFMGDAIMAFWNAPLRSENHARAACQSAIDMIRDVDELNIVMKERHERAVEEGTNEGEEFHAINIGIGVNTGTCVVGNMGSDSRFDYTALGDAVNLASRLEGQSKPYGIKIILGQATAHAVEDELATFEVDRIRVKGKQEPETIYALFGDKELAETEDFQHVRKLNQDMLKAYRAQDFETASALLELLSDAGEKLDLELDGYQLIYELRIAEFQANPPGRDWNGVYIAETK